MKKGKARKFKTSQSHRDKVNAWRAANKKAIAAAAKEGITLAAWRKKHGVKVKASRRPRRSVKPSAPATQAAASVS
jgi:hypothetical protein